MKLWELIKICSEGGYVTGDCFKDKSGLKFYFDGECLQPLEFFILKIPVNSEFEYIEKEVK